MASSKIINMPIADVQYDITRCFYCFCKLKFGIKPIKNKINSDRRLRKMPTREHIIPALFGGRDGGPNIIISCYACNIERGSATLDEFALHKKEFTINQIENLKRYIHAKGAVLYKKNVKKIISNHCPADERSVATDPSSE